MAPQLLLHPHPVCVCACACMRMCWGGEREPAPGAAPATCLPHLGMKPASLKQGFGWAEEEDHAGQLGQFCFLELSLDMQLEFREWGYAVNDHLAISLLPLCLVVVAAACTNPTGWQLASAFSPPHTHKSSSQMGTLLFFQGGGQEKMAGPCSGRKRPFPATPKVKGMQPRGSAT